MNAGSCIKDLRIQLILESMRNSKQHEDPCIRYENYMSPI